MSKKILITGASGFIGSFLVEEAVGRGWRTWAGIRKSSSREFLSNPEIRFIDLNFSDEDILKDQLESHAKQFGKWDYIIHNAGVTKCLNPADFERVNYQYTRNFIEALRESGLVPEKFILMSSLSAFPDPDTAYGKSKLKAEEFLCSLTDFPYMIIRPTGVYGPREKDYFLMMKTVKSGFDFAAGSEPQKLTFIYVKDLVKACFLALESPLINRVYCVADGDVYTDKEYTQIVRKALGKKWMIRVKVPLFLLKLISGIAEDISKFTGKPSTLNRDKYRIMKKRDWTCDTFPVVNDLGFKPDYNLEKGIKESLAWYKRNKWL